MKYDILKDRSKEKRNQQHTINSTFTEQSNPNWETDFNNEDIYVFQIDASTSSKLQLITLPINKNKVSMFTVFGSVLNIIDKPIIHYMKQSH